MLERAEQPAGERGLPARERAQYGVDDGVGAALGEDHNPQLGDRPGEGRPNSASLSGVSPRSELVPSTGTSARVGVVGMAAQPTSL